FETGLSAYLLANKFKLPMQVQIHTDFLSHHFRKSMLNQIRVLIARFIVSRADGLRVVSSFIKDSIKNSFRGLKIEPEVLPVYVDVEKIINTPITKDIDKDFPDFKFIILMASRLSREKRIDVAIKAMKEVVEKFPQTGLVICGSGKEKNKLKAYTKRLNLEKSVVFAGWHEDLISYYKTANLFLLTSEYEGYGMTLVEAGAAGCPIVTTKVGIAKTELFKDGFNCEICKFFDSSCVAESVISVISDNQKRELFKHRKQDSIRSMVSSREEYVSKYINLLESVLKK
ncbi:MAG TPA: glycosyltransferase, partial [Candidatus Paceibacterota bacterium]